jgi:hypothetical protein
MRTTYIRLVITAFAVVGFAGNTAAQGKPPGLLNVFEVQQLVSRGEPADHARLAAHFDVLANRYAAEAKRHTSMAQSFAGNPNRNVGTGMSAHCKQLADLNRQSATAVAELATYHDRLASGKPSTPPAGATRFESGAGAPAPSEKELKTLAASARTAADHHVLQEYFTTLARKYVADANEEMALAQTYRGTRLAQAAVHHDRLAALARDAAKEANDAAAMHEQLANVAR